MIVHHLTTVDGDIVFDVDPDVAGTTAGGTRLVDVITVDEVALLARATTYQFAVFEERLAGARAGLRPRLLDSHTETMERYCDEIRPMVEQGRFLTWADVGTTTDDFAPLAPTGPAMGEDTAGGGVGLDELAAARGVTAAAAAWLGGLERRSFAIDGFGAVGGAVAREVVRRGGTVVAVSTPAGAVTDGAGLDVDALLESRTEHGDAFVTRTGHEVHRPAELHGLAVDVLVPGVLGAGPPMADARPGVYTAELAATVQAEVISPAADVPYTAAGLDVLRRNRVVALPDFVCNAGPAIARHAPPGLTPDEVLGRVDRLVGERIEAARLAKMDPIRHATLLADTFLTTWLPEEHRPDGPTLAGSSRSGSRPV